MSRLRNIFLLACLALVACQPLPSLIAHAAPLTTPWTAPTVPPAPSATLTVDPPLRTPSPTYNKPLSGSTQQPTASPSPELPHGSGDLAVSSTATPFATLDAANQSISAAIDLYLLQAQVAGDFNGAALVALKGKVLLSKGYGLADTDRNLPVTPQTGFPIASLTKGFTALAVLMLQAQGKLDVNLPVCRYLPRCPAAWTPITIRELLDQTSGIPDLTTFPDFGEKYTSLETPQQAVDYFWNAPLDFTPGKSWEYSNSGYILLGDLIEKISGQSYASFIQDRIFTPLGMIHSGYAQNTISLAMGYTAPGTPTGPQDLSWLSAAGGLYASTEDLYRWDQALAHSSLIKSALETELFKPQAAVPSTNSFNRYGTSYGYGWALGTQIGRRVQLHAGAINGYSSLIERFPDDRLTIILLSNLDGKDFSQVAQVIAGLALRQPQ